MRDIEMLRSELLRAGISLAPAGDGRARPQIADAAAEIIIEAAIASAVERALTRNAEPSEVGTHVR